MYKFLLKIYSISNFPFLLYWRIAQHSVDSYQKAYNLYPSCPPLNVILTVINTIRPMYLNALYTSRPLYFTDRYIWYICHKEQDHQKLLTDRYNWQLRTRQRPVCPNQVTFILFTWQYRCFDMFVFNISLFCRDGRSVLTHEVLSFNSLCGRNAKWFLKSRYV